MKRFMTWFQHDRQNGSKVLTPSVLEDMGLEESAVIEEVKEACLGNGARPPSVDLMLHQYYGDYNH